MTDDPALFYTGLVADLYAPLRGLVVNPDVYADFVRAHGQPALELGCGDGHPIIELRKRGLDVDGIDSSFDMITRCKANAAAAGVVLNVDVQRMQLLNMRRRYKSIYLAGATFNLLPDDDTARTALQRIAAHLAPGGVVLVPLHIPPPLPDPSMWRWRETTDAQGRRIRFTPVKQHRDEKLRLQVATLRYERGMGHELEAVERDHVLHWYTREQFSALAADAGLHATRLVADDANSTAFSFWLTRP